MEQDLFPDQPPRQHTTLPEAIPGELSNSFKLATKLDIKFSLGNYEGI